MNKTTQRLITLVAAGVLLIASHGLAHAQTVKAKKKVRVRAQPGERARVVTRVSAGTSLKIVARRGRWLKVRVNGRTGWITRTSVTMTRQARTPARTTRRRPFVEGRSKRRGWSRSAPRDRVGGDAVDDKDEEVLEDDGDDDDDDDVKPKRKRRVAARTRRRSAKKRRRPSKRISDDDEGDDDEDEDSDEPPAKRVIVSVRETDIYSKPSRRSRSVSVVEQGDELTFVKRSRSGKWMLVENDDGDAGWIRSSEVGAAQYEYPKALRRGGARLGYLSFGSLFASDGQGELANYKFTTAAASVQIGGDYVHKYSKKYMIAVDGTYTGTRASPGIRFTNSAGQAADISFTMHEIDAGAALGYNLNDKRGTVLYGRVGYHYSKFQIDNVEDFEKNLAMLPSEILQGITIGARVDMPALTKKIGVRASLDALYPNGTRTQTKGLEDGAVSRVSALWALGHVIYQWKPDMTLEGIYRYGYSKTDWEGAATDSMRPHNATKAARKDVSHALMIGVGKRF